jgi:hypothetical protein
MSQVRPIVLANLANVDMLHMNAVSLLTITRD